MLIPNFTPKKLCEGTNEKKEDAERRIFDIFTLFVCVRSASTFIVIIKFLFKRKIFLNKFCI